MKCFECGAEMTTSRGEHSFPECGLSYVILRNIELRRCPSCGEEEIVIPAIDALHREITKYVARKPARLTPEEVRYLRKYLGWSGQSFAEHIGVDAATVSRWENGHQQMEVGTEKLLRWLALTLEPDNDYTADLLKDIAKKPSEATPRVNLWVNRLKDAWEPEEVAIR